MGLRVDDLQSVVVVLNRYHRVMGWGTGTPDHTNVQCISDIPVFLASWKDSNKRGILSVVFPIYTELDEYVAGNWSRAKTFSCEFADENVPGLSMAIVHKDNLAYYEEGRLYRIRSGETAKSFYKNPGSEFENPMQCFTEIPDSVYQSATNQILAESPKRIYGVPGVSPRKNILYPDGSGLIWVGSSRVLLSIESMSELMSCSELLFYEYKGTELLPAKQHRVRLPREYKRSSLSKRTTSEILFMVGYPDGTIRLTSNLKLFLTNEFGQVSGKDYFRALRGGHVQGLRFSRIGKLLRGRNGDMAIINQPKEGLNGRGKI